MNHDATGLQYRYSQYPPLPQVVFIHSVSKDSLTVNLTDTAIDSQAARVCHYFAASYIYVHIRGSRTTACTLVQGNPYQQNTAILHESRPVKCSSIRSFKFERGTELQTNRTMVMFSSWSAITWLRMTGCTKVENKDHVRTYKLDWA